jgi:hypothetical protein
VVYDTSYAPGMSERKRSRKKGATEPSKPPLLTSRQRDLALLGICPFCERGVRGHYRPNAESKKLIDDLLSKNIDPITGHDLNCSMPEVRL